MFCYILNLSPLLTIDNIIDHNRSLSIIFQVLIIRRKKKKLVPIILPIDDETDFELV